MKKFILSLLVLFGIGVLTACQLLPNDPTEKAKVTAVEITNTVTEFYVGDTVQIETKLTTSGDDADKTLSYETSCDKLATVSDSGLVSFLDDGTVTISVYSKLDVKVSDSITFVVAEKGPTLIEINNTISNGRVGDEFELDYTVSPSEYTEEVEVTVSDDSVLDLDGSTVKLIGVGTATITVASKVNAEIKDTLTIEVLKAAPTSITINNTETTGYVGETFTLDYTVNPSNADENVEITVDNAEVLTINGTTLSLVGAGVAEVTVKSTVDSTVLATLTVEVIKPDFLLNRDGYAANVDYSHMNDAEEAYLTTNSIFDGDNPHAFAMFNVSGTRYYAEATISMLNASSDGWARFGIGSATEDSDGHARAFFFSPKEGQKTVMMDVPNGWGAVTAQSMIWQANGINQLDPSNIKLAILRDGNCYYYLINDKLHWYEENTNFDGVNTYPAIITKDTQIIIMNWSYSSDGAVIEEKLALPAMKQVFFNADPEGRVNYVSDAEFSITSGEFFQNTSVKSIGDKALLKGNFAIEFDLSDVVIGAQNDNNTRIGIALRHVGVENPYKADTFAMANNGAQAFDYRVFTWSGADHTYWQGQDNAVRANGDSIEGHYKLVRLIENNQSVLKLFFNGEKVLEVTTSYVGDYHAMFGANLASGTFKNVTFGEYVPTESKVLGVEIVNTETEYRVAEKVSVNTKLTTEGDEPNKKLIYISSDESIATVNETGVVTFLSEGTVTITAKSEYDQELLDTITFNISKAAPSSITINNTVTTGKVGSSIELDYTVEPSDAVQEVLIFVDNEDVLVVEGSTVKLVAAGTAVITVKSAADEEVMGTLTIEVEAPDFVLENEGYAKNVDYSHMNDENGYLTTNSIYDGDNPHAFAMFNVSGTRYYAEANVSLLNSTGDGWARFGIGSASEDSDGHARAFFFSPKEGQKIVMMDVPNGWGAVTAQSMIWQANGINQLDPSNIKLAILRDGNCYYYLINDKLYWYEENANFNGVDTYPTIVAKDTQVKISDWSFSNEATVVDAKLALPAMKQVFFNADPEGRVNYVSDTEFSITSGEFFQNTCIKSIGDKALLTGNFAVEFDLSNVVIGAANDNNTRIGIALRYVGVENPYKADTFAMANNGAQAFDYRVFTWSGGDHTYWQGQDNAVRANGDSIEGHYKLVRTIENGTSTLQLFFNGEKVLEVTTSYVGDYHAMFGANLASGTFKNVVFYNLD